MPFPICHQTPQKLEALLPILVRAHTCMRFIDHDERRAGTSEVVAAPLRLDVVEAHDGVGIRLKQCLRCRQATLQTRCRCGRDCNGIDVRICSAVRLSTARLSGEDTTPQIGLPRHLLKPSVSVIPRILERSDQLEYPSK